VIKFSYFVNADETVKTTAAVTIEELCQSMRSVNNEGSGDSEEEAAEGPSVPAFGEAVLKLSGGICAPARSVMLFYADLNI
jgi:hypothetical protein